MGATTVLGISKTTANGCLAAVIGACGPLAVWLATQSSPKAATAVGIVTMVAAVCRVWVGLLQGDAPPPAPNLSSKIPLALLCALLPLGLLGLTGCPTAERGAYQSLAAAKSTLDTAQAAYEVSATLPGGNCASAPITTPPTLCIAHTAAADAAITKAKQADVLAVTLMEQYEEDKSSGAPGSVQAQAMNDVNNAVAALGTIIEEVKALYGGKP